jgi:hypothetical protein
MMLWGNYEESENLFNQAIAIYEKIYGLDHDNYITAYVEYGFGAKFKR